MSRRGLVTNKLFFLWAISNLVLKEYYFVLDLLFRVSDLSQNKSI